MILLFAQPSTNYPSANAIPRPGIRHETTVISDIIDLDPLLSCLVRPSPSASSPTDNLLTTARWLPLNCIFFLHFAQRDSMVKRICKRYRVCCCCWSRPGPLDGRCCAESPTMPDITVHGSFTGSRTGWSMDGRNSTPWMRRVSSCATWTK